MAFLSDERLLQQLFGYNPWWRGTFHATPQFKRVAFQKCYARLKDEHLKRAVMLSGPRRVGKSTVLLQIAQRLVEDHVGPRRILYVSLDDNLLKLVPMSDLLQLYRDFILPEGEPAYLLLDEVHYAANWDTQIKTLVDHHPEYRILATGSASLDQRQRTAHSGVGRWVTVTIPTLSFYEFLQLRGEPPGDIDDNLMVRDLFTAPADELTALATRLRPSKPLFARYLLVGGFPETARRDDITDCQRLLREDIVDRVLKRDVTAIYSVRGVAELERLFIYICLHSGGILNVSTCAGELGVSNSTVGRYLEILVQANLLYRVQPYGMGGKKTLKPKHKYYLVDAALRNAVLLEGEDILKDAAQLGRIVETTVLRHLYAYYYPDTPTISYWSDRKSQREVDIIVKSPRYLFAVEVKYRSNAAVDALSGLSLFCEREHVSHAFVITRRDTDFGVAALGSGDTKILRIPAHIFTYLLGQSERQYGA